MEVVITMQLFGRLSREEKKDEEGSKRESQRMKDRIKRSMVP